MKNTQSNQPQPAPGTSLFTADSWGIWNSVPNIILHIYHLQKLPPELSWVSPVLEKQKQCNPLVLFFVLSFGLRSMQKHISYLLLFIILGLICTCSVNFCNAFQNTNKTSEQVSAVRTVLTVVFPTSAYRTTFKNDGKNGKSYYENSI